MADKSVGILYIRLSSDLYKIANIKTGSDNSIYIFSALGPYHAGRGVDPGKFTYHPDGKSWMTSQMHFDDLGVTIPDEMVRQLEGWQSSGLGFKNGKLYTKDFDVKVPLADVKELLYLKFAMSYNDIQTINADTMLAKADDPKKISQAKVIDSRRYKHLTIRFYVVHTDFLQAAREHFRPAEMFEFEHPRLPLIIIAALLDEWAGDKDK